MLHVEGNGRLQRVVDYEEKPEIPYTVSMGVYVLEARALDSIPRGVHFDIPDLVLALLAADEPVGSYLFDGYWLDIGRRRLRAGPSRLRDDPAAPDPRRGAGLAAREPGGRGVEREVRGEKVLSMMRNAMA